MSRLIHACQNKTEWTTYMNYSSLIIIILCTIWVKTDRTPWNTFPYQHCYLHIFLENRNAYFLYWVIKKKGTATTLHTGKSLFSYMWFVLKVGSREIYCLWIKPRRCGIESCWVNLMGEKNKLCVKGCIKAILWLIATATMNYYYHPTLAQ